jgi:hypothetical protein
MLIIELSYAPAVPYWVYMKVSEISMSKRHLHSTATLHNSQEMETTKMSIIWE